MSLDHDSTILQAMYGSRGLEKRDGEVGIEIEVEGERLPGFALPDTGVVAVPMQYHWQCKADGSLRVRNPNDMAGEYVLRNPVARADLDKVLDYFRRKFVQANAVSFDTFRTSVHIHINAQQLPIRHVYSWLTTYFILEEVLTDFAGEYRKGNLFCLRAVDSEGIITSLENSIRKGVSLRVLNMNGFKYGAVNLAALSAYGSLEFRALRGTTDVVLIKKWIDMLLRIKDYSVKFDDPRNIIIDFSNRGPTEFLTAVLGEEHAAELKLTSVGYQDKLFNGMRLAQDVAYATNWEPVRKRTDIPTETEPTDSKSSFYDANGVNLMEIYNTGYEAPIAAPTTRRIGQRAVIQRTQAAQDIWNAVPRGIGGHWTDTITRRNGN